MTATPARDSDSEMEEMPLRERMATFDEELAEHRGLVERLAPGPPKVIAPLTVAEAFDLLDAAKAKDQVRHPPTPDPDPRPTSEARGSRDVTKIRNSTARTLRGEAARDARDARNPATALIPCRTDVYFFHPAPGYLVISLEPVLVRPLARTHQKQKKAHQAEDKASGKEMPAWWRLCEDYFRELRVSDLARVVPPHGWLADADPDLLVPPRGRPASREGGPDEATWWRDVPIAGAGGVVLTLRASQTPARARTRSLD